MHVKGEALSWARYAVALVLRTYPSAIPANYSIAIPISPRRRRRAGETSDAVAAAVFPCGAASSNPPPHAALLLRSAGRGRRRSLSLQGNGRDSPAKRRSGIRRRRRRRLRPRLRRRRARHGPGGPALRPQAAAGRRGRRRAHARREGPRGPRRGLRTEAAVCGAPGPSRPGAQERLRHRHLSAPARAPGPRRHLRRRVLQRQGAEHRRCRRGGTPERRGWFVPSPLPQGSSKLRPFCLTLLQHPAMGEGTAPAIILCHRYPTASYTCAIQEQRFRWCTSIQSLRKKEKENMCYESLLCLS